MPISVSCNCGQTYSVDDDKAGRRFTCKHCGGIVAVPQNRSEFENAGFGESEINPYATTTSVSGSAPETITQSSEIVPQQVELGDILNHSFAVWKKNLGILVAAVLLANVISYAISFTGEIVQVAVAGGQGVQQNPFGQNQFGQQQFGQPQELMVLLVGLGFTVLGYLVQIFLGIGHARMSLAAARGQEPEIGMLFSGGKWFLPALGASILFGLAMFAGFIALIVGAIFVALYFWPYQYLIVDDKCGVLDSFGVAKSFAGINKGTSFLLWLVSIGIALLGLLALCIGLLFALPLVHVSFATAYLMMSGQLRVGHMNYANPNENAF